MKLILLLACLAQTASAFCDSNDNCPGSFCTKFNQCATTEEVLTTKTSTAPAPVPAVNPLAPAAAADAKWVEAFLKKYQQIVAGVAIAVGFFFAFTGYKYFNVTLFLSAACIAGFVSFTLIDYYQPNVQTSKPYVVIGATAALALFSGFVVTKLRKLGVFAAGALGGASGAIMLNAAVLNKLPAPTSMPGFWLYFSMVILGILGGAMALKVERVVLIVSTSLAGSLGFVVGIAHFAGHFPTTASAFINPNTHKVTHDVWVWAYTLGFLVMVLVSTIVQFKTTSDRNKIEKEKKYQNSLLYSAPEHNQTRPVYVDHVSGYNTAV